jgi:hypothetical protein
MSRMNRTLLAGLLSLTATVAFASEEHIARDKGWASRPPPPPPPRHHVVSAPELDPAQCVEGLLLLTGTIAVLRGRRRKK